METMKRKANSTFTISGGRMMKVKMILPALTEAKSPFNRSIKYALFPPLGLATPSHIRSAYPRCAGTLLEFIYCTERP